MMVHERRDKVERIEVPNLRVEGDEDDAELLIVGWGGTYILNLLIHYLEILKRC